MTKSSHIITIPIYKEKLSEREALRVTKTIANSGGAPVAFVAPQVLDTKYYESRADWTDARLQRFGNRHFTSIAAYSNWLLTTEIYEHFSDYEFLLLVQTDAFLTRPIDFSLVEHDYIGAPWEPPFKLGWDPIRQRPSMSKFALNKREIHVGNGGLSIRRNQKMISFLRQIPRVRSFRNEDVVIGFFGPDFGLNVAPNSIAKCFFWAPRDPNTALPPNLNSFHGFHGLELAHSDLELKLLSMRADV